MQVHVLFGSAAKRVHFGIHFTRIGQRCDVFVISSLVITFAVLQSVTKTVHGACK